MRAGAGRARSRARLAAEARTRLVHDVLGRLLEVHEYTDASSVAVTRYAYDAGDRVRRIENADGVVTELARLRRPADADRAPRSDAGGTSTTPRAT
ncbi:MAG: hypothetical protein HS111_11305 [Kofleriaceae bacterium]|nr:hypothetical protein [Kofleriaceae bacterium]